MVVAGADVHVVAHPLALAAHHEHTLDVRLQCWLAVHDVHPRLLQCLGPVDVHALVEARLELDQRDRLLAALGGVDQRGHQRRVVGGAVHRQLDREHVRVGDGLLHEALDRGGEGVVGVMHEQVAFAHRGEHVGPLALVAQQPRVCDGAHRWVAQLGQAGQAHDLPQRAHVEQAVDGVDFLLGDPQQADQLVAQRRRAVGAELDAHDLPEAAAAQLVLDRLQQVGGIVGDLQVGVAGDAEEVVVDDLHPREKRAQVVGDHFLQRHERDALRGGALAAPGGGALATPGGSALAAPDGGGNLDEAGQDLGGDLHAREHGLVGDGVAHEHRQAEGEVGDIWEGSPGCDRERGERGKDDLLEVLRKVGALELVELPEPTRWMPWPARAGRSRCSKQAVRRPPSSSTRSRISPIVWEGVEPSCEGFSTPASIWSCRPATRTMKYSSRLVV